MTKKQKQMNKYLIKIGSQIKGPIDLEALRNLDVSPDTLVCKVGDNKWVAIVEMDELLSQEIGKTEKPSASENNSDIRANVSQDGTAPIEEEKHQNLGNPVKNPNEGCPASSASPTPSSKTEKVMPKYQSLYVFSIILLVFSIILGVLCIGDLWWNEALIIGVIPFILTLIVVLRLSQIRKLNFDNESADTSETVKKCRWMIGISVVLALLSLLMYETSF